MVPVKGAAPFLALKRFSLAAPPHIVLSSPLPTKMGEHARVEKLATRTRLLAVLFRCLVSAGREFRAAEAPAAS